MCQYKLASIGKEIPCMAKEYLDKLQPTDLPKKIRIDIHALPLDTKGLCIFHSKDTFWKKKNRFHDWLDALFIFIKKVDENTVPFVGPNGFKNVNLSGFYFIGKDKKLASGAIESALFIRGLKYNDHIQLFLEKAHFSDTVHFENYIIPNTELVLNGTYFEQEFYFSNNKVFQASLNDATLCGGIIINKCTFNRYTEFCGLLVEGGLQIVNTTFETDANFGNSTFQCDSFLVANNNFNGATQFDRCLFTGSLDIEECAFEAHVRFTDSTFRQPLTLSGNIYRDNTYFNSTDPDKKMFYDHVHFLIIDAEEEIPGKLIFDNVNFQNITNDGRNTLLDLARQNKVTIGSGCIKYRIQTPPIEIPTTDINRIINSIRS